MDLQALRDDLSELLGVEVSSLSRHVEACRPHLTQQTYPMWAKLRHLTHSSEHNTQQLTDLLSQLRISPRPVAFKADVARFHYVQLPVLLPLMIQEKQRKIQVCQQALLHGDDNPLVARVLGRLLDDYRQQLVQLEQAQSDLHIKPAQGSGVRQVEPASV